MGDAQMSTDDRLIYMANQIARNLATMGQGAVAAVADHIASFWEPRMKMRADVLLRERPDRFSPVAASALERLRVGVVASQPPATDLKVIDQDGRCDADRRIVGPSSRGERP